MTPDAWHEYAARTLEREQRRSVAPICDDEDDQFPPFTDPPSGRIISQFVFDAIDRWLFNR